MEVPQRNISNGITERALLSPKSTKYDSIFGNHQLSSSLQQDSNMKFDENSLTKGQHRKLNALRKSIGDDLADDAFGKWLARQALEGSQSDPVADKIVSALSGLENDRKFNLGLYGYTIRKARGKRQSGIVAVRNEKAGK